MLENQKKVKKWGPDITGKKFFNFTAIKYSHTPKNDKRGYWLCRCDCGKEYLIRTDHLKVGRTKRRCTADCPYREHKYLPGESGFKQLILRYKYEAKKRGYQWGLSEKDFKELTQKDCFYCGAIPSQIITHGNNTGATKEAKQRAQYVYNGIDRIDNSIGYIINNCITSCSKCNLAKQKLSVESFLKHIEKIYLYQNAKKA